MTSAPCLGCGTEVEARPGTRVIPERCPTCAAKPPLRVTRPEKVGLCKRCGAPTVTAKHWYCPRCATSSSSRNNKASSTEARGYGYEHQRLRKQWKVQVEAGGVCCATCYKPLDPYGPWDLGHSSDRSYYIGPQCIPCNRSTAKPKSLSRRSARPRLG
jgi:hypothetical protein